MNHDAPGQLERPVPSYGQILHRGKQQPAAMAYPCCHRHSLDQPGEMP